MTKDERIRLLIGNVRATASQNRENIDTNEEALLEIADYVSTHNEALLELADLVSQIITGGETA